MNDHPTRAIAITGATDGLGQALARRLADRPDTLLILPGRSPERLGAVRRELEGGAARVVTVTADLAELAQVRGLADQIAAETDRLDVLVNNAGVAASGRRLTVDGNELTLGVNYLAPFLLTRELLPLLEAGAPARVVNVASLGQAPLDLDDLSLARGYSDGRAYGQSKLALVADGLTLAERLPADRITVNSLHPGTYMPTKMVRESGVRPIDTLESGVEATLRLVEDPALAGVTGRFFDRLREAEASPEASDPAFRGRLLSRSAELVAP
jgi:NAD(P)-dependent dehydrogenase (short-subunit alcohol dehydrogenase family)